MYLKGKRDWFSWLKDLTQGHRAPSAGPSVAYRVAVKVQEVESKELWIPWLLVAYQSILAQDAESLADSMGVCLNDIQSPFKNGWMRLEVKISVWVEKCYIYILAQCCTCKYISMRKQKKYYIVKRKNLCHCILKESILLHEHLAITVKGVPVEYKIFSWK